MTTQNINHISQRILIANASTKSSHPFLGTLYISPTITNQIVSRLRLAMRSGWFTSSTPFVRRNNRNMLKLRKKWNFNLYPLKIKGLIQEINMKKEDIQIFENKEIKIVLQNDYVYTGVIVKLSDDCLIFRDRYDNEILIDYSNIKFIRDNTRKENSGDKKWKRKLMNQM